MILPKKISFYGLTLITSILLIVLVVSIINDRKMKREGVFVIARIYDMGSTKNGTLFSIEYFFKRKRFIKKIKPGFGFQPNKVGDYMFIRILPSNPKVMRKTNKGAVPQCLIDNASETGWKEIPNCP